MKILDFMSFNVEWFLTTQGMLITGGVLLLLIALIILSTSSKKEGEADPATNIDSSVSTNDLGVNATIPTQIEQPQAAVPEVPVLEPVSPVQSVAQPEISQPVNFGTGIADVAPIQQPAAEFQTINVNPTQGLESQPAVSPVLEINSMSTQPQVSTVDIPAFDSITAEGETTSVMPNISEINIPDPIAVANSNISVNTEEAPVVEPVQEIPQQPSVSIYGGVNPTQSIYKPVEASKTVIYGGADPLENTGAIPKVEINPAIEQPVTEVKVVEPVQAAPMFSETAVVNNESVSAIPTVSTVEVAQSSNDEIEELVF